MHEDEQEHIHLGGEGDPAVYTGEQVRLRSAGIDIGSSTSHLVFSDLVLARQGRTCRAGTRSCSGTYAFGRA